MWPTVWGVLALTNLGTDWFTERPNSYYVNIGLTKPYVLSGIYGPRSLGGDLTVGKRLLLIKNNKHVPFLEFGPGVQWIHLNGNPEIQSGDVLSGVTVRLNPLPRPPSGVWADSSAEAEFVNLVFNFRLYPGAMKLFRPESRFWSRHRIFVTGSAGAAYGWETVDGTYIPASNSQGTHLEKRERLKATIFGLGMGLERFWGPHALRAEWFMIEEYFGNFGDQISSRFLISYQFQFQVRQR